MLEYSVLNNLENKNIAPGEDETLTVSDEDRAQCHWREEDTQRSDSTFQFSTDKKCLKHKERQNNGRKREKGEL